jgi:segregation and condensation protein B
MKKKTKEKGAQPIAEETVADEAINNEAIAEETVADEAIDGEAADGGQPDGEGIDDAALVEAVLYLETEPVNEKRIAAISGLTEDAVAAALEALEERYSRAECGVEILRAGGGITIAPKKACWSVLKEHYGRKNEAKLSRAAMETLSIIAYAQPVTRAEIEAIRGVQADNMIRLLFERGLVRESGKKDIPGKPAQLGTTTEFLRMFRLETLADLPKLSDADAERFELHNPASE